MEYDIEKLAETFVEHAARYESEQEMLRVDWKENGMGKELPPHLKEGQFCLPLALAHMCREIIEIKTRIDSE